MKNFMKHLFEKYSSFMVGRNGMDAFGHWLLVTGIVIDFVGICLRFQILLFVADILFIYTLFRIYSKNTVKRSMENQSYLVIANWSRHLWKAFISNMKDKEHKYFVCPNCHQIVRVPKGRGQIEITCPTCHHEFSKKS